MTGRGLIVRNGGIAGARVSYPSLIMGAGAATLLIGVAGWNYDRLSDICDALAPLLSQKASAASSNAPASLADDKVIRIDAYCYDEGRRRICYVQ